MEVGSWPFYGGLGALSLLLTWLGVKFVLVWALRKGLLDLPNQRSSHDHPTPRGGGAGIVLVICLIFGIASAEIPGGPAAVSGALLIAVISGFDDIRRGLSPAVRLIAHILAASLALWGVSAWDQAAVPYLGMMHLGWTGYPLALVWIVGLVNSYNFMDGIDGIAGIQAVTAAAGWTAIGLLAESPTLVAAGIVIGSSAIGFLLHNWPPAKIFMGDVGSAFLGYTFAVIPLCAGLAVSEHMAGRVPFAGLMMVAPFVLDATFTFLRRIFKKEPLFQAHRSHIYQRLVIAGMSHRGVALTYLVLGLVSSSAGVAFVLVEDRLAADVSASAGLAICFAALLCLVALREGRFSR